MPVSWPVDSRRYLEESTRLSEITTWSAPVTFSHISPGSQPGAYLTRSTCPKSVHCLISTENSWLIPGSPREVTMTYIAYTCKHSPDSQLHCSCSLNFHYVTIVLNSIDLFTIYRFGAQIHFQSLNDHCSLFRNFGLLSIKCLRLDGMNQDLFDLWFSKKGFVP